MVFSTEYILMNIFNRIMFMKITVLSHHSVKFHTVVCVYRLENVTPIFYIKLNGLIVAYLPNVY